MINGSVSRIFKKKIFVSHFLLKYKFFAFFCASKNYFCANVHHFFTRKLDASEDEYYLLFWRI